MKRIWKALPALVMVVGTTVTAGSMATPASAIDLDDLGLDLGLGIDGLVELIDAPPPWSIVVKVSNDAGCNLNKVTRDFGLIELDTLMASRQVYLVESTDPLSWNTPAADRLAAQVSQDACVVYAEREHPVVVQGSGFHAWPTGMSAPSSEAEWRRQPGMDKLGLEDAQSMSRGAGAKVAVLDTGVDASHPYLGGQVVKGWDYVDDDPTPAEEEGDVSGHGTFIAGLIHLVAPDAKIIPMRVLDGDGDGSGYRIAEAIRDSVSLGAKVINLSFGTTNYTESKVLTDVIKYARSKGAVVVAAAGNDGDEAKHWPAAQPEVISVSALDSTNNALASYSTRGRWVDVAALGTDLISLAPGGGFDVWSGTSMAAPVVSAQTALVMSAAPGQSGSAVEGRVKSTTQKLRGVNVSFGRVNLVASIRRALDR